MKRYPIMEGPSVPWAYMEPHEAMAMRNHQQTLTRLSDRGGLSPAEAEAIVSGIMYREIHKIGLPELTRRWHERAERVNREYVNDDQLRAFLSQHLRIDADVDSHQKIVDVKLQLDDKTISQCSFSLD